MFKSKNYFWKKEYSTWQSLRKEQKRLFYVFFIENNPRKSTVVSGKSPGFQNHKTFGKKKLRFFDRTFSF